ncbi:MAG: cation-translocating P-type ATPase [Ilumatobacter sp.]|nr:cation-translocating P-type ATPase [Ilumatobacter sp.]
MVDAAARAGARFGAPTPDTPWQRDADDVCAELRVDADRGLDAADVAERRSRHGSNELVAAAPVPAWRRFVEQFDDPLVVLLLVAIAISLGAWASEGATGAPLEAIVIAAIVALNALIGFWQETRALHAVRALQMLTGTRSTVVRDAVTRSIPSSELVPGDVVLLAEGDAVGADCRVVESASLEVAEAALTGESEPVAKQRGSLVAHTQLADRTNMVFNGTAVSRGRGRGVVVATGMATEIGRIASMLDATTQERTPLQQQIDWLGKMLGVAVIALSSVVVAAIVATSDVSSAADLFDALLVGVSLAVAAIPEGLPAILTVVLALGVKRMADKRAIVKKLLSVETLGSASVICTDKTGTLTRNEMTIVRVLTASTDAELTGIGYEPVGHLVEHGEPITDGGVIDEIELVLRAGSLANDASIRADAAGRWEVVGDPTEIAFLVAERKLGGDERRQRNFQRVAEVPFDSDRKLMSTVESSAGGAELMVVTKGAPEVLAERCTHERVAGAVVALTAERRAEIAAQVDRLGDQALRTLAVAYRPIDTLQRPVDESIERDMIHLGVVGIIDPPRPEAAAAIAEANRAGVRVLMITGDHPRTATRIGAQLGIGRIDREPTGQGITGRELVALDDDQFADVVDRNSVFARVAPEHKLRIVETLQDQGQIVAMTGDGVNDAPALKQADIGVAMGINGTEVSKEAADMILADDNFATILHAVREGREIFADIRKFLRYLLASNTGEVLVVLIGVLAAGLLGLADSTEGLAVPLLATQILWINLLTDSVLALALGVDPAVEDVMSDQPRALTDRVIDAPMLMTIVLVGVVTALAGLVALDLELPGGMLGGSGDLATARTMAFTTVVLAQIFNAFNSRSDVVSAFVRPFDNRLLWAAVAVTVVLQVAVVHVGPLNRAFDTVPLDGRRWAICLALASSVLVADEIRKLVVRMRRRPGPRPAAHDAPGARRRNVSMMEPGAR